MDYCYYMYQRSAISTKFSKRLETGDQERHRRRLSAAGKADWKWNPFFDFQIHLNINWSAVVKNRFSLRGGVIAGGVCLCVLFALHNSLQVSSSSFLSLHLMKLAEQFSLLFLVFSRFKRQRIAGVIAYKRNERIGIGVMPTPRSIRFPWRGCKRIYREKWIFGLLNRQGRTGRCLMEHLLHHRRLPSPLVYFFWCYLQWRQWVGFSPSHPWNLYGSLLWCNSAQPTVYNVCNGRVYLYPCEILNKSNSHSNEDLVSVLQYARAAFLAKAVGGLGLCLSICEVWCKCIEDLHVDTLSFSSPPPHSPTPHSLVSSARQSEMKVSCWTRQLLIGLWGENRQMENFFF